MFSSLQIPVLVLVCIMMTLLSDLISLPYFATTISMAYFLFNPPAPWLILFQFSTRPCPPFQ